MQWHFNDLSLDGQFTSPLEFRGTIEPLLKLRYTNALFRERFYCTHLLSSRPVTQTHDFSSAIRSLHDQQFTNLVLGWVTKYGPFWDDERTLNDEDYFECMGIDVTEQGLGEAARKLINNSPSSIFSLIGTKHGFDFSPVIVQHGLTENVLGKIQIHNYWTIKGLTESIDSTQKDVTTWEEVVDAIGAKYRGLVFSQDIRDVLTPYPFSKLVSSRIFELLDVLESIVNGTQEDGSMSADAKNLYGMHFFGDKAWFSDESDTNKNDYEKDLTFSDPLNSGNKIMCSWHGKIKTPQYRVHFEWPRPQGQRQIKVLYIGPKLTRT